jgi:hypothetical protein
MGGGELYLHPFLTLVLHGDEWSNKRPRRFNPGKRTPVDTEKKDEWVTEPVWTFKK